MALVLRHTLLKEGERIPATVAEALSYEGLVHVVPNFVPGTMLPKRSEQCNLDVWYVEMDES